MFTLTVTAYCQKLNTISFSLLSFNKNSLRDLSCKTNIYKYIYIGVIKKQDALELTLVDINNALKKIVNQLLEREIERENEIEREREKGESEKFMREGK